MPATTQQPQEQPYVVDEKRHSVVLTRHLAVSVEQAFAFWTEPRHVSQWWDASGEPLVECSIDLRVGGQLRFVGMRKDFPPFTGRYLQLVPPRLIVFEAMGATGTVTLQAHGKGSRIVVEIRAPSPEALQAMLNMGIAVGTAQTLSNLEAFARAAVGSQDRSP